MIERSHIILDGAGYTLQGVGAEFGIKSVGVVNVTVQNIKITGFQIAIDICQGRYWVIANNSITNNSIGIRIYYLSSNNTIIENHIANNGNGIKISAYARSNNVVNNTIVDCDVGVVITSFYSEDGYNNVMGNWFTNNDCGVFIDKPERNTFYHNNFVSNAYQVYIYGETENMWDNGSEGNYWSDYDGTDANGDGIGDTPYIINQNNMDNYPLMQPWSPPWGDWEHYHGYNEIVNTLIFLNSCFPKIVEVFSIGKSRQGRDIYCIRLTNETITYMLNKSEIYIIPALNVDGFEAVVQNEWQRKNAAPTDEDNDGLFDEDPPDDEDGDGYIEDLFYWDGNTYYFIKWEGVDNDNDGLYNEDWVGGVDLNRNYGYQWDARCQSGSPNPWDEDYRGPAPFSEPETRAIRDLAMVHNFKYAISFDSGAECVVYPWGYTTDSPPDEEKFEEIATEIAQLTSVWYMQSGKWYTTSGVWDDWMYGNRSVLALTCEIYRNDSAWQYEPGPEPYTWWERGVFQFFNPDSTWIGIVIQRWLPVFTYIINRAINEFQYHDICIISVNLSKTVVGQGFTTNISVSVANQGNFPETFNVTVYANITEIGTKTITLQNSTSATLTFTWNTIGLVKGNYIIWAYAWPVPGETDIRDNTLTNGQVYVGIPGDINADKTVNYKDAILLGAAFGSQPNYPNWNPNADINNDKAINYKDAIILGANFEQTT